MISRRHSPPSRHGQKRPRGVGARPLRSIAALLAAATVMLLAACDPEATVEVTDNTPCLVERVTDGDTIRVSCLDESIRMLLVAAPEVANNGEPAECYGDEARDYLRSRLPEGTEVTLEAGVENTDQFGRYLRYVFLAGEHINETLVREGYAVRYRDAEDTTYRDDIARAEDEARKEGIGLWAAC